MSIAIKVENVSKQYRLGKVGTGTLSHDLNRWWHLIRGKEDPYLKIGETNDRTVKGDSDYVWALRDINFEINQGDAVGIIGRNGAGKSTLLKILSRTTAPTTGTLKLRGRVASLLEVGTGFHPELSGRENIYLNGAILGMTRKEISSKFDEIVDFSGVERYIDTPVKRYSSGMYVRLAFAVAAHLESEILIVDEVLAVGDAEFQKKCLGKMREVSKREGRTVLFVSHNMASIKSLCDRGIILENGQMNFCGTVDKALKKYLGGDKLYNNKRELMLGSHGFEIHEVGIIPVNTDANDEVRRDMETLLYLKYSNITEDEGLYFNLKFKDDDGRHFMVTHTYGTLKIEKTVEGFARMHIPAGFFNEGNYALDLMVISKTDEGYKGYINETDILHFQLLPERRSLGTWMGTEVGQIRHKFYWDIL